LRCGKCGNSASADARAPPPSSDDGADRSCKPLPPTLAQWMNATRPVDGEEPLEPDVAVLVATLGAEDECLATWVSGPRFVA
jgi:hypothetical protein